MENILPNEVDKTLELEPKLEVDPPSSIDGFHDLLTHYYSLPIFYETLEREISFAKREGNLVGIVKFQLLENATEDQMLYFANELELAVRQHDLIARIGGNEFAVLLRLDTEVESAFKCLVARVANFEKRGFRYAFMSTDGTKGLVQVLDELDNPQILHSSKTL